MGGDRIRLLACAAAAALATPAPARGQQTSSAQAPATASDTTNQDEEIVVRADGDQVRIDRRVYAIHNDPIAQSTDMFDVLGRIPSVSIDPSGTVSLLGAGNPQIQINHQPLPQGVTVEQALRGLQGADVERIEVITNPSAQFSSAASGGVIDIITRQRFDRGFSGMANLSADSFGSAQTNFSPSWSHGPLTLGARAGYYSSKSDSNAHSTLADLTTGDESNDVRHGHNDFNGAWASLEANYQFDPKNKATLSFNLWSGAGDISQTMDRTDHLGPVFHQDQDNTFIYNGNSIGFQLQHDGAKPSEQLRFDASYMHGGNGDDSDVAVIPASGPLPGAFLTRNNGSFELTSSTLDYDLPIGERAMVSTGLSANSQTQHINDLQRTAGGSPTDFSAGLIGREQTLAAYGTYQFGVGDWLALPGVRFENYRREVTSAGSATDTNDLRAFPTVHLRRSLAHVDVDLSFTSRIERPDVGSLNPAVRFTDATHAMRGNPNLRPTTVDAYEASLTYQEDNQSVSLTFFDRLRHDVSSSFSSQIGDVIFSTTVNAGDSEKRGLEATLRGGLGPRWRYAFSANALSNAIDVLRNGALVRDDSFQYFGNASIEYRDRNQNEIGANDAQLELRFHGPEQELQSETEAYYSINFSWRRRFTDHLFGFVQVRDVFASNETHSFVRAEDFTERGVLESPGARIRASITYQFGSATDRPPPPPSEGGGGPQ